MSMVRTLAVAAAFAVATPLLAQTAPGSGPGAPGNPYARPPDMAPNDKAIDSASEQIRQGVQRAADDRVADAARSGGRARPAKKTEVIPGAAVADTKGVAVGKIETVEADGAIVLTAAGRAKIPLDAFGFNKAGLLVGMTKAEFEQLVATANR
jgi:hypothetical protein